MDNDVYEALRSHMIADVIKLFNAYKIAVVAIPAHNTNKVQLLVIWIVNMFKASIQKDFKMRTSELWENDIGHEHNLVEVLHAIKYA